MHCRKVTIVGVGLLGGSLGLALRQRGLADRVEGLVRRATSVRECHRLGVVDRATRDPVAAVEGADLVIVCTPIAGMEPLVRQLLPGLAPGAVVTDVGSVKGAVVAQLEPLIRRAGAHFVGSHPMAGAERTGPSAARANLFDEALCVVTPTARSNPAAVRRVERFWKSVGMRVLRLSPSVHDALVARSSHLPHLVATSLAAYVLDPRSAPGQASLCATGFRDTTRIASSSPAMWRDIALTNRRNLERALGDFIGVLQTLRRAVSRGDQKMIEDFLQTAKARRDRWCARARTTSPE